MFVKTWVQVEGGSYTKLTTYTVTPLWPPHRASVFRFVDLESACSRRYPISPCRISPIAYLTSHIVRLSRDGRWWHGVRCAVRRGTMLPSNCYIHTRFHVSIYYHTIRAIEATTYAYVASLSVLFAVIRVSSCTLLHGVGGIEGPGQMLGIYQNDILVLCYVTRYELPWLHWDYILVLLYCVLLSIEYFVRCMLYEQGIYTAACVVLFLGTERFYTVLRVYLVLRSTYYWVINTTVQRISPVSSSW